MSPDEIAQVSADLIVSAEVWRDNQSHPAAAAQLVNAVDTYRAAVEAYAALIAPPADMAEAYAPPIGARP